MISKQPQSSKDILEAVPSSSEDFFVKNQEVFQKGQKSFKEAKSYDNPSFVNEESDSETEAKGGFIERLVSTISTKSSNSYRPLPQKDKEDEDKRQDEDCCGDCNSINCPHCDCTFW